MEIKFKRDTSFRKQFFVPDSFAHPAKMDAQLLLWIAERYTKVGEVILDPMAGSGMTMLACMLGRDVVLVELEEKFCKMCRDNWEQVKMRPQLGYQMGHCQIILGDARRLVGLVDKIVTSPPYIAQTSTSKQTEGLFKGRQLFKNGRDPQPHSEGQIGDLPYGKVDKCIFSPPYAEAQQYSSTYDKDFWDIQAKRGVYPDCPSMKGAGAFRDSPENISNLPYGQIDKIVTSPPYEEAMGQKHHSPRADKLAQEKSNPVTYTDRVDSIITSPPYEEAHDKKIGGLTDTDRPDLIPYSWVKSDNEANIGNLKSQSYLEAMLQVYRQCFSVLKPQGLMILVTKNFIRNKQVVRLDEDTIKLCEQAGFSFLERHSRKLPSQSFWRVIYHQKHPEVEQIKFEDILVLRKAE